MPNSHRWAVVVTVAVDRPTVTEAVFGSTVSLERPHAVAGPLCYDCGAFAFQTHEDVCTADRRAGYPE